MDRTLSHVLDGELAVLLDAIYDKYSYDFRQYAPNSLRRTISQAMRRMGCATLEVLRDKVLDDPASFGDLVQSLTIPVSEMFRDPEYFRALREHVCPYLRTYPSVRVWVAGCSTGEEVYSIAIMLREEGLLERTTIYATDINDRSLQAASSGCLPASDVEKAARSYEGSGGKALLSDYYSPSAVGMRFHDDLRRSVTFSNHSLVTDAVFTEAQLISCRNVMIYFNRDLQNRVYGLLHESLSRRGFLGLGAQETIQFSSFAPKFARLAATGRIFQKI